MDFRLGPESDAVREEARRFLRESLTREIVEDMRRSGVSYDKRFNQALVDKGWMAPSWPVEFGGAGMDALESVAFREECQRVDAPMIGNGTTMMCANVIRHIGTEFLKQEIIPRALRGEILIVLGLSEPTGGSDVFNAQTRAVRDGDEWVINGQKMFTTNGHLGDYVFLLTRTNTSVPKHRGLTVFLVPMNQAGVEAQAVYTLSGERTNITYYTDVRVDDRWRIGEIDGGLAVMVLQLELEHAGGYTGEAQRMVDHAEQWAKEAVDLDGRPRIHDPDVRARLAKAATEIEVGLLMQRRVAWQEANGTVPDSEGSMVKLLSTERYERMARDLHEMVGPDALRSQGDPSAPVDGAIDHGLRHAKGTTIYAGTSEIQRNIVAGRVLGLPRG